VSVIIYFKDLGNHVGDNIDVLPLCEPYIKLKKTLVSKKGLKGYQESLSGTIIFRVFYLIKLRKSHTVIHIFCGLHYQIPLIIIISKLLGYKVIYSPFGQLLPNFRNNKSLVKVYLILTIFKLISQLDIIFHFTSNYEKTSYSQIFSRQVPSLSCSLPVADGYNAPNESRYNQFLYFGRLSMWQKGLDLIVGGVKLASAELRAARFKVILAGRVNELELLALQQELEKLDITDIVTILPNVTNEKRLELYRKSRYFIHPSRIEGFARSMRDALSAGLPMITTLDSNAGNLIADYDAGIVCETSSNGVASAIENLVNCTLEQENNLRRNVEKLVNENNTERYKAFWNGVYASL
jgi:glycosyltransferase involved in cell wall biosynthesis